MSDSISSTRSDKEMCIRDRYGGVHLGKQLNRTAVLVEEKAVSIAPVSYTHLDVYKRQRYGIETSDYSFGYIAGWSSGKETKELKSSLDTMRKTAAEMIEGIDTSSRCCW